MADKPKRNNSVVFLLIVLTVLTGGMGLVFLIPYLRDTEE